MVRMWLSRYLGFPRVSVVKNLPANAEGMGLIPRWGRSPGGGDDNPLQYSCLENPTNRGACWTVVDVVARVRHDHVTQPLPHAVTEHLEWFVLK